MSKLLANTTANATGRIASYLVQLLIIAFLVKQLGKAAFGVVVLAEGLILNKDLFESAFGISTTKYIAECDTKDVNKIKSVINANYLLTFLFASLFCVILVALNHLWLTSIFNIPENLAAQAIILVDFFIAGVFFDFFRVSLTRISEGFQDYVRARIISFSKSIFWLVFTVVFFMLMDKTLTVVGYAYLAASFCSFIFGWVVLNLKYRVIRLDLSCLDVGVLREMFKFSGWLYLSKFSMILSRRAHIFIIGYFLNMAALAYYHIAYKIYEILNYGRSLISSTLVPFSSKLEALNDRGALIEAFGFFTKISVYLTGIGGIFLFFRIDKIITILVGEGFEPSYLVARIMIASVIVGSLTNVGVEIMVGIDRFRKLVKFVIICSLINLGIVLLLINFLGLVAVAIGGLISTLASVSFYLPVILKELDLRYNALCLIMEKKAVILFIIYASCLYFMKNLWISFAVLLLTLAAFLVLTGARTLYFKRS